MRAQFLLAAAMVAWTGGAAAQSPSEIRLWPGKAPGSEAWTIPETTTTSGFPAFSTSGRIAVRTSPAKKCTLSMPFMRAFFIASAIACSITSIPQTSPAEPASARLIVPMPQNRS